MAVGVRALEERGDQLSSALSASNVLAYRGAIDTETMLDTFVGLHDELNSRGFLSAPNINEFVERYKGAVGEVKALRMRKEDFEVVRTLARGQFGIVDIVRSRHDQSVYAMKTLNKQALLSQREQAAFLEERDVLVLGRDSSWIPDLHAAFQDGEHLYLVMEFVAGGDLFSMLDRCEGAVIDEDAARFYAAELVLALEDVHALGYVHRDCKPQNTLLDSRGHVKLADFGSCARMGAGGAHEAAASVPVGTCDYIAPETLRAREAGGGVDAACDWWAVGAVLYEMLYGDPPFYSDSVPETYAKIMACDAHLVFGDHVAVSDDAKDLMRRLLVRREDRLDGAGIRQHAFFAPVDWAAIRDSDAPFVPAIGAPDDTSNFSVGDDGHEQPAPAAPRASTSSRLGHGRAYAGEQLPFAGFTYAAPRGPSDVAALRLRARVAQLEAAQGDWDAERRRLQQHVAPARRDAGTQTDAPAPRLSTSVATLSPHPRRSISSAVDDLAPTVVATLVAPAEPRRVTRAERRVSAGVASDALSVVGVKCDRLAARMDAQTAELAAIHGAVRALAPRPESATPDGGSRRGKRPTVQRRDVLSAGAQDAPAPGDARALELYKAVADDLVLALRAQVADAEQQRAAAEARASDLLAWIGRESKGRALLEDMIRTAQQACRLAEDKFDAMLRDADHLRAAAATREEDLKSLHATVEARDKELRQLRRASRKALDQLADLKNAPPPPPPPGPDPAAALAQRSIHALELEIQEAAAVHVRVQFEIARLESEVSRLESDNSRLVRDAANARDRQLRDNEARARAAAAAAADSDGIRVRAIDPDDPLDDDAAAAARFGSIGAKSHKRLKIQLQNMQKHIEYLETKLALAVSENDALKRQQQQQRQQQPSSNGIKIPGFSRSASNGSANSAPVPPPPRPPPHPTHASSSSAASSSAAKSRRSPNGPRARPMSTMFSNLAGSMDSSASLHQHQHHPQHKHKRSDSAASSDSADATRHAMPSDPHQPNNSNTSARPRNDSLSASFDRIRSPFKGFRKHFS
ncbi:Serine/threonine-protein kinase MRCK alpha [Coemansia thaxteri]|nr:Serine/threonine-protein kinase MRCK alpha [Coemansia thaxteri]